MTTTKIAREANKGPGKYEIAREAVKGPGKYESEPAWVAFAWEEIVLHGCAREDLTDPDDEERTISLVDLDEEIRAAFPDAPEHAALYQRSDGFVCRADYDACMRFVAELRFVAESAETSEDE